MADLRCVSPASPASSASSASSALLLFLACVTMCAERSSSSSSSALHFRRHHRDSSLRAQVAALQYQNAMLTGLLRKMVLAAARQQEPGSRPTAREQEHYSCTDSGQVLFSRQGAAAHASVDNDADEYYQDVGGQEQQQQEYYWGQEDDLGYYDE